MKKFIEIVLEVLLVLTVFAIGLLILLTVTEYKPLDVENAEVIGTGTKTVKTNADISLLTWNIGYSALGKESDFVMDGGGNAPVANRSKVNEYFAGIQQTLKQQNADINFIQEIDLHSTRSYYIDMTEYLSKSTSAFAYNYKCPFVPFPWPPLATINSGVFTTTDFRIENAIRKSVPCPFSWPLSTANLKRGLLVSYLPVEGTDKKLVLINLHLEAYSENEGRIKQLLILNEFMENEFAKGNYVIAGGDFNQTFPGTNTLYKNTHKDNWDPNEITSNLINSQFKCESDYSTPTCRLLNQPYDPSDTVGTQYYVIDGFIVTPNIDVKSVKTIDAGFENSDHNPVRITFQLKK